MSLYVQGRIINFMVVELCAEYKISCTRFLTLRTCFWPKICKKNTKKTDDAKLVFNPLGRPGKFGNIENQYTY